MPRIALLVLAATGLIACSDEYYRLVKSPDGARWWYELKCAGGVADCLEDAHQACLSAYDVVETNATGSVEVAVQAHAGPALLKSQGTKTAFEMLVQCRSEVVPPGTSKTNVAICRRDPLMRSNMEFGLRCAPEPVSPPRRRAQVDAGSD